jgi:hypothetical protein
MSYAPSSTYFDRDGTILGMFRENDHGNVFEFSVNDDDTEFYGDGYPHKVWVTTPREGIDSGYRYAIVKKTVAYIVVDEDENGLPICDKWLIKGHRMYVEAVA